MPRKRRAGIRRAAELTSDQEIELLFGGYPDDDAEAFAPTTPQHRRSAFASPFLRRTAWHHHGQELMEGHNAGMRPAGYWLYQAPERPRKSVKAATWTHYVLGQLVTSELWQDEAEADCLARLGLLEDWEIAETQAIASLNSEPSNPDNMR